MLPVICRQVVFGVIFMFNLRPSFRTTTSIARIRWNIQAVGCCIAKQSPAFSISAAAFLNFFATNGPGVASPGGAGYDFWGQSIAIGWTRRTNGLGAHGQGFEQCRVAAEPGIRRVSDRRHLARATQIRGGGWPKSPDILLQRSHAVRRPVQQQLRRFTNVLTAAMIG